MNLKISADRKYATAVFYVLNRIKDKLLFDPQGNQVIDYMFNLNIKLRPGPGLMEEREILQKLRMDGVIFDSDEVDMVEFGEKGTSEYEAYELYHFKVSKHFDDYYDRYQRIQNVTENYCWFDNNTFFLTLRDGSVKAISFDTERQTRHMLALFQAFIEHWKNNGDKPISKAEVVELMVRYGSKVDAPQLKNIFSNIRNKKIKPAGLENKIIIGFDKKFQGWTVDIKR